MISDLEREEVARAIGTNLKRLRMAAGFSQDALGRLCDLHRTEVGLIERGERVPGLLTVVKLTGALGTTPDALAAGIGWKPGDGYWFVEPTNSEL